MAGKPKDRVCSECKAKVPERPTVIDFEGQEIFLFHPVVCAACLTSLCERYATVCANCGGAIPPYSQVGVLKDDSGGRQFVHMSTACHTVGSAFHGYWGRGKLHQFVEIEAC